MSKQNGILQKIQEIPRSVIYVTILIFMIIPTLYPLGLPVPVSEQTKAFYAAVDSLKPGNVILELLDYSSGSVPIHEPGAIVVGKHAVQKKAKIVYATITMEGTDMYVNLMKRLNLQQYGYVYGKDYVFLGYAAGDEVALSAIASNIRSVYTKDFFGTPIDNIEIMKNVRDYRDYALVIQHTAGSPEAVVRQFVVRYGVKFASHPNEMMYPTLLPYYAAGQMVGLMKGAVGVAEYETIAKMPGDALKLTDVQALTHMVYLAFMLLANIGYTGTRWLTRKQGGTK